MCYLQRFKQTISYGSRIFEKINIAIFFAVKIHFHQESDLCIETFLKRERTLERFIKFLIVMAHMMIQSGSIKVTL